MKNILIVSSSFYPENSPRSFRTTELVKEFAKQGHEVTLLTLKKGKIHRLFEQKYGVVIKNIGPLHFPKIRLNAKNNITHLLKKFLRRGLHLFFEYPDIELMYRVKKALASESGYDIMISVAVPHPIHWGVAWARNNKNTISNIWVADCGDPYMGATLDTFNKMFYFKLLEKYFCKKADFITVPLEEAKAGYYPEFKGKIKVIPQGFNFDEVGVDHSSYSPNPIPTFAYAGGLIPGGRDPRKFLDYLVSQYQNYKFILYTRSKNLIDPYVKQANGSIEVKDYIPRKNLLKELSQMDFLINFENSTSKQLPSKLIDYYLTGRPVFSIGSGTISKKAIDEFLNGNYGKKYVFSNMDRYRINNVCKSFLELC